MDVGTNIREAREALGMPGAVLARRSGVSGNTIWRIEHGERLPSLPVLQRIADALHTTPSELLREEETADHPLAEAPSTSGRTEQETKYLRSWRAFVWKLVARWKENPPRTGREVTVVLDTIQALVDEGVFERPPEAIEARYWHEASEGIELQAIFIGLQRLNQIADSALEEDPETVQQRHQLEAGLQEILESWNRV
jgi:transcriptional regulator with XRE-family HTH domain